MTYHRVKNKDASLLLLIPLIFMILSLSLVNSNHVFAAEKFSVDVKINLKKLNLPDKLKVVASASGEHETKYLTGSELRSNTATVSFEFNQKNGIVDAGSRDEYFVCAYALDAYTEQMKSFSCAEGNIENTDGKNTIGLGSGTEQTLSSGRFQTVSGGQIMDPTIKVWIPLSDRKDAKNLKVVAMIKGEFQSKIIDAQKLLKQSEDKTLMIPLVFDKIPEIGTIQEGDMFFACVSGNDLNPPEGTECEHRKASHTAHIHNIVAR
ncbi:MAG TPA: hypothetical protein VF248_00800 [Nitrososphaeraceae archaeon]